MSFIDRNGILNWLNIRIRHFNNLQLIMPMQHVISGTIYTATITKLNIRVSLNETSWIGLGWELPYEYFKNDQASILKFTSPKCACSRWPSESTCLWYLSRWPRSTNWNSHNRNRCYNKHGSWSGVDHSARYCWDWRQQRCHSRIRNDTRRSFYYWARS